MYNTPILHLLHYTHTHTHTHARAITHTHARAITHTHARAITHTHLPNVIEQLHVALDIVHCACWLSAFCFGIFGNIAQYHMNILTDEY